MIKYIEKSLIFLFALVVMVGCNVDKSYDLKELDGDGFGFGTDDTSFVIPLFRVRFAIPEGVYGSRSGSYTFEAERVISAIEVGRDVMEILDRNLDGDKNTISLVAESSAEHGLTIDAKPRLSFTDENGVNREFEVGSVEAEGCDASVIANIDTLRALLDSVAVSSSITIDGVDFKIEDMDVDERFVTIAFSAYKRGSLKL